MDAWILDNRYEVRGHLASGGMADLYLAQDLALDRQVAVKILTPELAADPDVVERFRREALASAALNHPNIVRVYDQGVHGGIPYMVMEYVPGSDLAALLRRHGPAPEGAALGIAAQIAAALGEAHRRGLIHQDVKPHNVLLDHEGRARVTDFGIAVAADATGDGRALLGSVPYLSPEQVQGGRADARSDLYSLGALLYELLVTRPPFLGDSPAQVAMQHVHTPPVAPRQLRPGLSAATEAVVLKALRKDASRRYQNADEMRLALERARRSLAQPGRPALPAWLAAAQPALATAAVAGAQARAGLVAAFSGDHRRLAWTTAVPSAAALLIVGTLAWPGSITGKAGSVSEQGVVEVAGAVAAPSLPATDDLPVRVIPTATAAPSLLARNPGEPRRERVPLPRIEIPAVLAGGPRTVVPSESPPPEPASPQSQQSILQTREVPALPQAAGRSAAAAALQRPAPAPAPPAPEPAAEPEPAPPEAEVEAQPTPPIAQAPRPVPAQAAAAPSEPAPPLGLPVEEEGRQPAPASPSKPAPTPARAAPPPPAQAAQEQQRTEKPRASSAQKPGRGGDRDDDRDEGRRKVKDDRGDGQEKKNKRDDD